MFSYFFSSSSSTPQTRFEKCQESKQLLPLIGNLRDREKILNEAAKKEGVGTQTFSKHVVVEALLTSIEQLIDAFNRSQAHTDADQEIKDVFLLIQAIKNNIDIVFQNHNRDLGYIRGTNPQQIHEAMYFGTVGGALVTALFAPLTFVGGVTAILGASIISSTVSNACHLKNFEPKSLKVLKELRAAVDLIHANLNLYLHRMNITASTSSSEVNDLLFIYSDATQAYLNSFERKRKNTDVIAELQLTSEEENLFEAFLDPITNEIMNRPVLLNCVLYDLDTILNFDAKENGYAEDPYTKFKFYPRDIQSARHIQKAIEATLEKIVSDRECNQNAAQVRLAPS